jgi:hypothetical protein
MFTSRAFESKATLVIYFSNDVTFALTNIFS